MTDPIPARLAALKTLPMPELKAEWRRLFETEPPQFNRRALENRLAYRIQELAYGGLKPETRRRLEILGEQYDSDNVTTRRIRHDARPVAGTRLVREYRGVEHTVTVLADGYEWQGRPYRSLSAMLAKQERYAHLMAEEAFAKHKRTGLAQIVLSPAFRFLKGYVFRGGFLDGWRGLVYALLRVEYVRRKYLKQYLLQKGFKP